MHASDIVFALKEAAEGPHALQNVRRVLNGWRGRIDEIAAALDFIPGTDGNANQAFYRTPELSVLKVLFPSGRRPPPGGEQHLENAEFRRAVEGLVGVAVSAGNEVERRRNLVDAPAPAVQHAADILERMRAFRRFLEGEDDIRGMHAFAPPVRFRGKWWPISPPLYSAAGPEGEGTP